MGELSIRTADWKDLPEINLIYQYARKFMAEMAILPNGERNFRWKVRLKRT